MGLSLEQRCFRTTSPKFLMSCCHVTMTLSRLCRQLSRRLDQSDSIVSYVDRESILTTMFLCCLRHSCYRAPPDRRYHVTSCIYLYLARRSEFPRFFTCWITTTTRSIGMKTRYPFISSSLPRMMVGFPRAPSDLFAVVRYMVQGDSKTTVSLKTGLFLVSISIGEIPPSFALVGLRLRMYVAYSAASPQNVRGNPLADTKLRTIFIMVQCIRLALPLLAWLSRSLT